MELLDDYISVNKKETEFGIKQYSCQDILFCMMRILFGIFFTYMYKLWLPLSILCLLFICKAVTLVVIIISSRILSKHMDDYSKREIGIQSIDSLNMHTALFTVVVPHILQFILCFYIASLFFICSSKTGQPAMMWIIGLTISIINCILLISALDIFANEGFTIPLNKNLSFDTQKNYWGEGLIIIFWSFIYLICSLFCCYDFLDTILSEAVDYKNYIMFFGMIIFIASIIQTIKCLNLPDIYKTSFGNIRFYDYISYQKTLLNCRELYISYEWKKIFALAISIPILVISVSFMGIILNKDYMSTVDTMTTIICIIALSFTATIFILRRMCKVPLLKGLFEEEYPEYFSEYIDLSNNVSTFYLNHKNTDEKKSCF